VHSNTSPTLASERDLAEALERGEVIHYPRCPFKLPEGADLQFLLEQRLASRAHKNIGYDPNSGKVTSFRGSSGAHAQRLHAIFSAFSETTTSWLANLLPRYAALWQLDRVSYRPEEEATRKLRPMARNDLLHVDAFPSRPTNGARILRVFANINPTEPRVWLTSDPFARLLERYGREAGLPAGDVPLLARLREGLLGVFQPARRRRSAYDSFMLRLHNFLKANDDFQRETPKRVWNFSPGSAWLVITDTASHAVLRGRFALEHSYFLAPETLTLPDESPPSLLRRACGREVLRAA
jgi:3-deoxy-D-manno-oct-2-ulosonic acid (Kdo) hydroxylase